MRRVEHAAAAIQVAREYVEQGRMLTPQEARQIEMDREWRRRRS